MYHRGCGNAAAAKLIAGESKRRNKLFITKEQLISALAVTIREHGVLCRFAGHCFYILQADISRVLRV